MRDRPLRVAHIITGLEVGGAEMALLRLIQTADRARFEWHVISLTGTGAIGRVLESMGIPLLPLNIRRFPDLPGAVWRMIRSLERFAPDTIHCWMYHAQLVGAAIAAISRRYAVIWSVHHGRIEKATTKRMTRLVFRATALLSRIVPICVIYVSEASLAFHRSQGYKSSHAVTIPNGCDIARFTPDAESRQHFRAGLGIPQDAPVLGFAGRFHPDKDPAGFVRAMEVVRLARPEAHFVMCGRGMTAENRPLASLIHAAGLASHMHLLGLLEDTSPVFQGLDLLVMSSRTESFPNVLIEAMACGIACVSTEVGDAALILEGHGKLVAAGDAAALGRACLEVLSLSRGGLAELGARARQRVAERYRHDTTAASYCALYSRWIEEGAPGRGARS